jgi:hypothetical protein
MATRIKGRQRPAAPAMIACSSALVGATGRGSSRWGRSRSRSPVGSCETRPRRRASLNIAPRGTHRRFTRNEAIVACLIHGFALHQIAIGELVHVSRRVRLWLQTCEEHMPRRLAKMIDPAIRGKGDTLLVVESWRDDDLNSPRRPPPFPKGADTQIREMSEFPDDGLGGRKYVVSVFPSSKDLKFQFVHEPEGFVSVISLRSYLSKIDS